MSLRLERPRDYVRFLSRHPEGAGGRARVFTLGANDRYVVEAEKNALMTVVKQDTLVEVDEASWDALHGAPATPIEWRGE